MRAAYELSSNEGALEADVADVLRRHSIRSDAATADIYLAYSGVPKLQLNGVLIAKRGDIDSLIAYCPISPGLPGHRNNLKQEISRQLEAAQRIAAAPDAAEHVEGAILLRSWIQRSRPIPHWVYGLSCVPLTREWTGAFIHPRPFCPVLFEAMLVQPAARKWLEDSDVLPIPKPE